MKLKVPWVFKYIGLHKPNYRLGIYKPDFSDPNVRFGATLFAVVVSAILFSGFIYIIINLPPAIINIGSAPGYFVRNLDQETTTEAIIIITFMLSEVIGGILMRRSIEETTEESRIFYVIGLMMFVISAFVLMYFLYSYKINIGT